VLVFIFFILFILLHVFFPFLVFPISLANAIANSFGGLGLIDVVGGFCASFLTTGSIYLIRKAKLSSWFIIFPILLVPALVVPIWLSALLKLPYFEVYYESLVNGIHHTHHQEFLRELAQKEGYDRELEAWLKSGNN